MSANAEVDVLSEVLRVVKLDSAFYFNAEFSAPWTVDSPPSYESARYLSPQARHLIIFHLVIEGSAYVDLDGRRIPLDPGDIVTFPHGDAHVIGGGDRCFPIPIADTLAHVSERGLALGQFGGGGDVTRIVCGFLACDPDLSRPLLDSLPPVIKLNIRGDAAGQWIENSIRFSVVQAAAADAGSKAVLAKLSETVFVETIRRYLRSLPDDQAGWLAGIRDPEVGRALALLHGEPRREWTLADLSHEAGLSRTALAERFRKCVGEPPMAYLTRWRLRLGAQMLRATNRSIGEIAVDSGYESEAAFNRAFKREFARPPARYRNEIRGG